MLQAYNWVQYADNAAELVIAAAGILTAFFTLRKNSKYIGSRMLALGTTLIGFYGLCVFTYDISAAFVDPTIELALIYVFLRLSMLCILFGTMSLYFAFQIVVQTEDWLKEKKHTWPYILGICIYGVIFYTWTDAIQNVTLTPVVNNHINLIMVAILGVSVVLLMVAIIRNLVKFGIKHAEGEKKIKMTYAVLGFTIALASVFINIASVIVSDLVTYQILVLSFFLVLAAGISIVAYGFITPGA